MTQDDWNELFDFIGCISFIVLVIGLIYFRFH